MCKLLPIKLEIKEWKFACGYGYSDSQINTEEGAGEAYTQVLATERVLFLLLSFIFPSSGCWIFFSPLLFIVSISFSPLHFNEHYLAMDHLNLGQLFQRSHEKHDVSLEIWDCVDVPFETIRTWNS